MEITTSMKLQTQQDLFKFFCPQAVENSDFLQQLQILVQDIFKKFLSAADSIRFAIGGSQSMEILKF